MKILFACSEAAPFVKTGGLGDVAGSLPSALAANGNEVIAVLPRYKIMDEKYQIKMQKVAEMVFLFNNEEEKSEIYLLEEKGVKFYFVGSEKYFKGNTYYENEDMDIQFAFYTKAVLEMVQTINFKPDIIHCNDWHTGLIPWVYNRLYKNRDFYRNIKTVYTIHNLQYQGVYIDRIMEMLDIKNYAGYVNFMKEGIENSDIITTVSPTYVEEIQTDYFGVGLSTILRRRNHRLYGILNGIDTDFFNPETDKFIYKNYSFETLKNKEENKLKFQEESGIKIDETIPMVGMVTRLASQKGIDIVMCVLEEMLKDEMQFVLLGSGEKQYEEYFLYLKNKYPEKVSVKIGYDSVTANRIYAASDIFLMPSLFEPCGLSQMISMRYGTVPVVRETGGLNDTVKSYNEITGEGNGFTFKYYNAHDMMYTVRRAIDFYKNKKEIWSVIIKREMLGDYTWKHSAMEYEKIYKKL